MSEYYGSTRGGDAGGPALPVTARRTPGDELGGHLSIAVWMVFAIVTVVVLAQYE